MVTEAANINGVFHQQNMVFFTAKWFAEPCWVKS